MKTNKIHDQKHLRAFLIQERKRQGLTQQQVADRMQTSRSRLARREQADTDIKLNTLISWLEALNCTMTIEGGK